MTVLFRPQWTIFRPWMYKNICNIRISKVWPINISTITESLIMKIPFYLPIVPSWKVYYSLNSSIYFSMSSPFSRTVKYENSWRLQSRSLEHLIGTVRRWGWHISFTNQSIGGVSPSVILHIARQLSISSKYSRA